MIESVLVTEVVFLCSHSEPRIHKKRDSAEKWLLVKRDSAEPPLSDFPLPRPVTRQSWQEDERKSGCDIKRGASVFLGTTILDIGAWRCSIRVWRLRGIRRPRE